MKWIALTVLLGACATPAKTATLDEFPAPPPPSEQHAWLQQLVGEWTVTTEATMEPGAEPMKMESTEFVRSIGGLWTLGEGHMTIGDQVMNSFLTLGYDPAKNAYVGTWIDTMQTTLWVYRGTLDASGKVLTLVAEGPAFGDSSRIVEYHDVITIKDPDHRTLTSSVQDADGKWVEFMKAEYKRRK